MPRLPIDYANTVIYKIVCNDLNITECYVGHTTDFVRRKQGHKDRCRNERGKKFNLRVYQIIRETGGWENYSMIEIEKYPCNSSNEACTKEREWFEKLHSILNKNFPQRYVEEWREVNRDQIAFNVKKYAEDNKVEIAEYKKQYAEDNRDQMKEYKKQHYEINKNKLLLQQKKYHKDNREEISIKQRQYKEDNKEKILEIKKKYREDNKTRIKEKSSERFVCECGREINLNHKSRHLKSKVHNDHLKTLI